MSRFFIALIFVCLATSLKADGGGAYVVATCGTLPVAYAVGSTRSITVNTSGQACLS